MLKNKKTKNNINASNFSHYHRILCALFIKTTRADHTNFYSPTEKGFGYVLHSIKIDLDQNNFQPAYAP